jgi:excisionase family DNA binding protein
MAMKSFYSVKEFAEIVGMHHRTIWQAIKDGKISAFRIGNSKRSQYRIAASEIERLAKINLESIVNEMVEKRLKEKQ